MIRYLAERHMTAEAGVGYDILACECEGDIIEVLAVARDRAPDRARAAMLTELLNSGDVDPLHMEDIIEDALCDLV